MSVVINGSAGVTVNSGAVLGITSGTAVASTSGTSIDFTSIPSWVKRINVMLQDVSTNGSSVVQLQIGSSSFSTTGYMSTASYGPSQLITISTGFALEPTNLVGASTTLTGIYTFTLIAANTWVGSGNISSGPSLQATSCCAGYSPALSGTLDRVRLTTVNGTDAFDAGRINILYE